MRFGNDVQPRTNIAFIAQYALNVRENRAVALGIAVDCEQSQRVVRNGQLGIRNLDRAGNSPVARDAGQNAHCRHFASPAPHFLCSAHLPIAHGHECGQRFHAALRDCDQIAFLAVRTNQNRVARKTAQKAADAHAHRFAAVHWFGDQRSVSQRIRLCTDETECFRQRIFALFGQRSLPRSGERVQNRLKRAHIEVRFFCNFKRIERLARFGKQFQYFVFPVLIHEFLPL